MKQVIISFFIFLSGFGIQAQNSVFVLVDVSRSVSQEQLNLAKQTLSEVLNGNNLSGSAYVSQGNASDLSNFKLLVGDKLGIAKFGSLNTTIGSNLTLNIINNLSIDINPVMNSISWVPTDNQTYYTLAKAKVAEFAKINGINKYKLFIISDNIQDDYGPGGSPSFSSDNIRSLVEGYNTTTNPVRETPYTIVKYLASSDFKLSFSPEVDVTNYSPTGGSGITPLPAASSGLKIEFTTHKDGTIAKPKEIKSDKFMISWSCKGAPSTAQYKVRVSPLKIQGAKTEVYTTAGNNYSLSNLADGKYRITVSSAQPNLVASSSSTIIEVKTNSSLTFLWVLLFLAAIGGGYWYWNKKRNEKMDTNQKTNDVFSSNGNDNSSPDYF